MAKCSDLERSYTNLNGLYSRLQANHSELEAKTAAASQTPGGSGADLAASDTSEVVNAEALVPPERSRASSIASRSSVDPLIRPPSPFQVPPDEAASLLPVPVRPWLAVVRARPNNFEVCILWVPTCRSAGES